MPLYEFECQNCQNLFETIQKKQDPPKCPKCGSSKTQKVISRFAVGGQGDLRESTDHGCHGPVFAPDQASKKEHSHHHDHGCKHPKKEKK